MRPRTPSLTMHLKNVQTKYSIYVFILVTSEIHLYSLPLWKHQIRVLLFQLPIFLLLLGTCRPFWITILQEKTLMWTTFMLKLLYWRRPNSSRDIASWKSRIRIWIFRRQIWIHEVTRIKNVYGYHGCAEYFFWTFFKCTHCTVPSFSTIILKSKVNFY